MQRWIYCTRQAAAKLFVETGRLVKIAKTTAKICWNAETCQTKFFANLQIHNHTGNKFVIPASGKFVCCKQVWCWPLHCKYLVLTKKSLTADLTLNGLARPTSLHGLLGCNLWSQLYIAVCSIWSLLLLDPMEKLNMTKTDSWKPSLFMHLTELIRHNSPWTKIRQNDCFLPWMNPFCS